MLQFGRWQDGYAWFSDLNSSVFRLHCKVNFFTECLVIEEKHTPSCPWGFSASQEMWTLLSITYVWVGPAPRISPRALYHCVTQLLTCPQGAAQTPWLLSATCVHLTLVDTSVFFFWVTSVCGDPEPHFQALLSLDSSGCVYADLQLGSGQLRSCECFHCRPTHTAYAHDEVAPRH